MKYKVQSLMCNTYQVIDGEENLLFQGSISDCEAYIRLKENNNIDF